MTQYPKKSSWIVCLLNECSSKGDPEGSKIRNLVRQILQEARVRQMQAFLVLVNNASTDNTLEVLQKIAVEHPRKIVVLDEPVQGKARAERTGFNFVLEHQKNADAIITLDADGEHDIRDMTEMCRVYACEHPLMVVGSRFLKVGKRNKKDEILRGLLVNVSSLDDAQVPDDPRCGGRVYDPLFIREVIARTVAENYGLQYELVSLALSFLKSRPDRKIVSVSLENYEPQRSKVFRKKQQIAAANPELADLCRVISSVFGKTGGYEEEGKKIIIDFGISIGNPHLFVELSELFFKGKMVTDHGAKAPQEFMEAPPTV